MCLFTLPPLQGEVPNEVRRRGSARRHDLRTPTGGRRRVGRLCRSKAIDCLVEALTGNVRQARLMKNTPQPLRGGAVHFAHPWFLPHYAWQRC